MTTQYLALPLLVEDVQTQFDKDANSAKVVFGWRQVAQRINQGPGGGNRVVFEPGEDKGKAGEYKPPIKDRKPFGTRSTRSLMTFNETCTVYCWGFDASAPDDETAQYTAARLLHDFTIRAIYRSPRVGHASFDLKDPAWVTDRREIRFGAAIKFTLIVYAKISDDPGPPRDLDTEATTATSATGENFATGPVDEQNDGTDNTP